MKYGIIGNRDGFTYDYVKSKLIEFNITKNDEIVSGGAKGVDEFAKQYAKEIGCKFTAFLPTNKPSPECYFERNRQIIDYNIDVLIAFNNKAFGGTTYTLNYARRKTKHIFEYSNK